MAYGRKRKVSLRQQMDRAASAERWQRWADKERVGYFSVDEIMAHFGAIRDEIERGTRPAVAYRRANTTPEIAAYAVAMAEQRCSRSSTCGCASSYHRALAAYFRGEPDQESDILAALFGDAPLPIVAVA